MQKIVQDIDRSFTILSYFNFPLFVINVNCIYSDDVFPNEKYWVEIRNEFEKNNQLIEYFFDGFEDQVKIMHEPDDFFEVDIVKIKEEEHFSYDVSISKNYVVLMPMDWILIDGFILFLNNMGFIRNLEVGGNSCEIS